MGRGHLPLGGRALRRRGVQTVRPVRPEPGRGARKHGWIQFLHDASSGSVPMPSPGLETLALSRISHPRPSPPYTRTSTCHVPGQSLIGLRLWICLLSLLPRRPSRRAEVLYYLAGLAAGR